MAAVQIFANPERHRLGLRHMSGVAWSSPITTRVRYYLMIFISNGSAIVLAENDTRLATTLQSIRTGKQWRTGRMSRFSSLNTSPDSIQVCAKSTFDVSNQTRLGMEATFAAD